MKTKPFKTCPNCQAAWKTMDEFLSDTTLVMEGYQVHFEDLKGGLFLFTHRIENCYTTMAVPVKEFIPLSNRSMLELRRTRIPTGCSDLCMRQGALDPCPLSCECSWVREIMQKIREWPGKAA